MISLAGASGLASPPDHPPGEARAQAVDLHSLLTFDKLIPRLMTGRVVYVGETHDRYDHHLNQLEIIRRLYQLDPKLAIGVEYFQQAFQPQVDDYIAGRISEREFLHRTEYYERWRYDYRLYSPIFRFAREHHIPVVALNVATALSRAVGRTGIAGLSPEQKRDVPREIDRSDEDYKVRLEKSFQEHSKAQASDFQHFLEAQLVWDEGMAESAAAYLKANPGRRMVILAGAGHIEFGSGIPKRVDRRTGLGYAIVLSSSDQDVNPKMADYLLFSEEQELPPPGILGVNLEEGKNQCWLGSVTPGSAAEKAGLKGGDVLMAMDGEPVRSRAGVRVLLWDKKPGDRVRLRFRRKGRFGPGREQDVEVELTAPGKPAGHP